MLDITLSPETFSGNDPELILRLKSSRVSGQTDLKLAIEEAGFTFDRNEKGDSIFVFSLFSNPDKSWLPLSSDQRKKIRDIIIFVTCENLRGYYVGKSIEFELIGHDNIAALACPWFVDALAALNQNQLDELNCLADNFIVKLAHWYGEDERGIKYRKISINNKAFSITLDLNETGFSWERNANDNFSTSSKFFDLLDKELSFFFIVVINTYLRQVAELKTTLVQ